VASPADWDWKWNVGPSGELNKVVERPTIRHAPLRRHRHTLYRYSFLTVTPEGNQYWTTVAYCSCKRYGNVHQAGYHVPVSSPVSSARATWAADHLPRAQRAAS
jgi:hypothetical protein